MSYRIGIGYDIHRLVEGRKLCLGGVEIPYIKGLLGHSDADALLHAICDALLGAAALGDIGEHFPDRDQKYENIQSAELLKITAQLVSKNGFKVSNIDVVIIAQEPPLTDFKRKIKESISGILAINENCVNIKAKTNEGLGELGRREAIACYAVVALSGGD
jgi:2-C-methyl-D-erythritol 2,4-cyclodiphosphate synthase